MTSDLNSDSNMRLQKDEEPAQGIEEGFIPESKKFNYPGCFKKSVAFLIDQIVIAIVGIIIFFPFSDFIGAMYQHGWLPGYLLGAVYFAVLESAIFKSQSVGKMIFSLKVITVRGGFISPIVSFGRYFLITLPFLNSAVSNSIASTIGITNTCIGGTLFLAAVGVLLSGNTLFMLFHPQKRGLHDIIFKTVVVPVRYEPILPINHFTIKPVISGIIGLAILGFVFGNLFIKVGKDFDLANISDLSDRIQKETSMENISASYRTFYFNGKQTTFSIEVQVPIPYDKFEDKEFTDSISSRLYPLVKRLNTNSKVDTITMVFHAQKYYGAFPIYKTSRNPKKIVEIDLPKTAEQEHSI